MFNGIYNHVYNVYINQNNSSAVYKEDVLGTFKKDEHLVSFSF